MKNNQKGFSAVEGLLVLVILGLVGFSGWYVYHSKKSADTTLNNTAKSANSITSSNPIPSDWLTYSNKDLGFKFSYPKSFGQVTLKSNTDGNGASAYTVSFSALDSGSSNITSIAMENPNFERAGIGSVCNLGVALPDAKYSALKPLTGDWVSSRNILLNDNNMSAIESVSFPGDITGGGAMCPDSELVVLKKVTNKNFEAIKVYHSERTAEANKLKSQAEYNKLYASTPNAFISNTTRNDMLNIARSITIL